MRDLKLIEKPRRKIRVLRAGSLRSQVRDLLAKGGTREDVELIVVKFDKERGRKKPRNVSSRARGAIYLLQRHVGYGMVEKNGKLKLVARAHN